MNRKDIYTGFYMGAGLTREEAEKNADKQLVAEETFFGAVDITPPWLNESIDEDNSYDRNS